MVESLKEMLVVLLTSKKAQAALAGMVVAIALRLGINVDVETVLTIISPIIAYIIGQGIADAGKEAAKQAKLPRISGSGSKID